VILVINAPHDKEFVLHDGSRIRNLLDLTIALEKISDVAFSKFVNTQKNDFSNWIEFVLLDKNLADKIRYVLSKNTTVNILKDRINEIAVEESIMKMTRKEVEMERTRESTKKVVMSELSNTEKNHEQLKDAKNRKKWFHVFSRKKLSDKKLSSMGHNEEDKYRPEKGLGKEIDDDYRENILWTLLYFILIILIFVLLLYKLLS
jgi:preprotein translocase subunit SecF